jgi:8-amino-7-oxononanoate synthase
MDDRISQVLSSLEQRGLLRTLRRVGSAAGPSVMIDGKQYLLLCSNDYLGLAGHPALREAAAAAMERCGFGSGAARLVSGNTVLHEELEERISRFKSTEAALLFNSGYAANTGIIPALAGEGDAIFSDSLNHASIIDGCRLSRGSTFIYRHRDMAHLEQLLRQHPAPKRLIVTDGVFSMDGDIAPLPEIVSLAERYDALLMVDDAHATGVLGRRGRGTVEHFGLEGRVPVQMGTLGKALGSFGAYVAGSRELVRYLMHTARSFLFSTSLPPAVCAASIAAITIIDAEPWRRERLWRNRERLATGLAAAGFAIGSTETPIIPVMVGDAGRARMISDRLFEEGIYATSIRPPTVPPGASRIRTTVTAGHTDEDVDRAVAALSALKDEGMFS